VIDVGDRHHFDVEKGGQQHLQMASVLTSSIEAKPVKYQPQHQSQMVADSNRPKTSKKQLPRLRQRVADST
jgi:ribonucleotide monophosphatase NagD (HAD superfamily)